MPILGFRVFRSRFQNLQKGFQSPIFEKNLKVTKTIEIASNFMIFNKKMPKIVIFLRSKFQNFKFRFRLKSERNRTKYTKDELNKKEMLVVRAMAACTEAQKSYREEKQKVHAANEEVINYSHFYSFLTSKF